jgi:RNA polymerase-binding transcription factor DksA
MAKFLDCSGVQAGLTELIKNSGNELYIVSPYLKISPLMRIYLSSIDSRDVSISIVYRSDSKIADDDLAYFKTLGHLKLYQCDNLHTKCYMNDSEGLITSMNLHEHSQTYNWEMGIHFSKADDPEIFADVTRELGLMTPHLKPCALKPGSQPHLQPKEKPAASTAAVHKPVPPRTVHKPTEAPNKGIIDKIIDTVTGEAGYCIRCGKGIPRFDLQKPYCDSCYASWSRYKNPKYKEKYCHACGEEIKFRRPTFEKPVCKGCFERLYRK